VPSPFQLASFSTKSAMKRHCNADARPQYRSRADNLFVFANDTILVQVSDRRGSAFAEAYTDFVSSTPQHFGAMNLAYWWSREKFKPGAV
jgi:hypothetical protein